MILKRPASLRRNLLGSVSLGSAQGGCVPETAKVIVHAANHGDLRITQVALALKAGRGHGQQLKRGTVWQGWSP